jgi:hypothetical protein
MVFLVLPLLLLVGAPGLLLWRLYSLEEPRIPLPPRPPSRPGLWYCSHRADVRFPFQHLFIRITPSDGAWAARRPDLFGHSDADGTPYCTLGAGPRDGKLFLEFNRAYDLRDPVGFEEPILCRNADEENAHISALLDAAGAYGQSLEFAAWSRISGPGFARHTLLCPGIGRGLPKTAFREPERP